MGTFADIGAVSYHLPAQVLSNADLALAYPEWSAEKIGLKTGIEARHVVAEAECSSDLAVAAAEKLFASGVDRAGVDFLLLCTQSPDYFLPTTACLVQDRLGLATSCGALDFNLGCSGYIYGLGLAKGLIETGQASNVLLITAETYTKFIHAADKSVRTIFGDAAAASLIVGRDCASACLGPFVYGTDGRGAENLIVPSGGIRTPRSSETGVEAEDESGSVRSKDNLYMNGGEIFNFTLASVPQSIGALIEKACLSMEEIDLFVFHQANAFMLEHLRRRIGIPKEKFLIDMADCGNTVSSTIPIALSRAMADGRLQRGMKVLLIGFGVGYSWGATIWQS